MWKKDDVPEPTTYTPNRPDLAATPPAPAPVADRAVTPPPAAASPKAQSERATIGRSISIKGEVTGDEDLLIQGRIEGSVDLKQHSVTVGREGEVKADLAGRVITVEGKVVGNLMAEEQVVLRSSAQVQGDIAAPRVVLEDGARFRGGVDMGEMVQTTSSARTPKGEQRSTAPIDVAPRKEAASSGTQEEDKGATAKADGARKTAEASA